MVDIPASAFTAVPGQPNTQIVQLPSNQPAVQGLVAPAPAVGFLPALQTALDDASKGSGPGHTALQPPNNIHFTDLNFNISADIPGDGFTGATPGITSQFVDLTPDNLLISALTAGTFLQSDTGNDLLTALGGRNILAGGGGSNAFLAGSGQDTIIADATKGTSDFVLNFGSGDDLAVLGIAPPPVNTFSAKDGPAGLQIDVVPADATKAASSIVLAGYKLADFGGKLSLGISTTPTNQSFLFIHGN